jgi:hypothetical protein
LTSKPMLNQLRLNQKPNKKTIQKVLCESAAPSVE